MHSHSRENYKCVQACKQYPENHRPDFPGLYLYGNCGTWKTHLAVAIARELMLLGKQVVFTGVPGLCFDIKKTFQKDSLKTELDERYPLTLRFIISFQAIKSVQANLNGFFISN